MAKLTDKFFNRVIEGPLELEAGEKIEGDLELSSGSEAKIFENIVDKDGHKRFDKGDIRLTASGVPEGTELLYGKWSLSGTHLMFVGVFSFLDTSSIVAFSQLCDMTLPKWVYDKIVAIFGSANNIVDEKSFNCYATNGTSQVLDIRLIKTQYEGIIIFQAINNLTLTSDKKVRIAFDLIID